MITLNNTPRFKKAIRLAGYLARIVFAEGQYFLSARFISKEQAHAYARLLWRCDGFTEVMVIAHPKRLSEYTVNATFKINKSGFRMYRDATVVCLDRRDKQFFITNPHYFYGEIRRRDFYNVHLPSAFDYTPERAAEPAISAA